MENNTIILDTVPHRRKWYSFEEAENIEVSSGFLYLSSRWVRYRMIIHAHWSVKISYLLLIFSPITAVLFVIDIICLILTFVPKIGKFCLVNLWDGLKWFFRNVWELCGEMILAFCKKFLSVAGIFCAIYAIYVFFRTGAYQNVYEFICKLLK